ncbi:MAG: MATE family efflux transporter [Candidatus Longimicrobiales bacterium M2_2A_002]
MTDAPRPDQADPPEHDPDLEPPPSGEADPAPAGGEPLAAGEPEAERSRYDRAIVEGALLPAVWAIAWPTMLQNVIGGLQGIVDHAMVGHYVGYEGNAAIGVSWQIFLVVVVFISSLFTGMSVLVARFAGRDEEEKVDRTVYQAFLTAMGLALGILAPIGYLLAPALLDLINAAPDVQVEALPYLRIMFVFSPGMLVFFMLGGALRSAGDARTPLRIGVVVTILNVALNVVLIAGLGPVPAFGTAGAAMGTVISSGVVAIYALGRLIGGGWVVSFPRGGPWAPDWSIIKQLFRFGLPTGIQGIAMNVAGVFLLRFVGSLPRSAAAQAAYAVGYTQLFSFITWTSVGLMGAAATVAGQNLGADNPERSKDAVQMASRIGVGGAIVIGSLFLLIPETLLGLFGLEEPAVLQLGTELLTFLAFSGIFVSVALTYTGGLQGTGDTKSPLYISIVSQIVIPLGICFVIQQVSTLDSWEIWLAILLGHITRSSLSVLVFRRGRWRDIEVEIEPATP